MTLKQIEFRRVWAGRVAGLWCLLLFLLVIDALLARLREPPNHLSGWPGAVLPINGMLSHQIERMEELSYQTPSPDLRLEFDSLHKGFWLGGNQWNGRLHIGAGVRPGEYPLTVIHKKALSQARTYTYRIEVFADPSAMRRNSKSFFQSRLGIRPGLTAALSAPFVVLLFVAVFLLSRRAEALMAAEGKAEIYRIQKEEEGFSLYFALGSEQGLRPGQILTVTDRNGETVAEAVTTEVFKDHSLARVRGESGGILPGYFVTR